MDRRVVAHDETLQQKERARGCTIWCVDECQKGKASERARPFVIDLHPRRERHVGEACKAHPKAKAMNDSHSNSEHETEVDAALLDAELFVKYGAMEKALKRLQTALLSRPRSIILRERVREIASASKRMEEAARQCLALASIYIERDDFETAHERLLEAKQLDPRINIAAGLEAIRRARRPDLNRPAEPAFERQAYTTLAGDLSVISIFDIVQVLENARLSGVLAINGEARTTGGGGGRVFFSEGRIKGAETADGGKGEEAFRKVVEITEGAFEFQRSAQKFPENIKSASNTNLILDALRQLDEEKK
jgi:tetratricopeptide (TPR) repeat protein